MWNFFIPIQKYELYKHLCDNIYEIFGRNLNTDWVFEDITSLLAVILCNNDIVFMLKKKEVLLSFYRCFLKCL